MDGGFVKIKQRLATSQPSRCRLSCAASGLVSVPSASSKNVMDVWDVQHSDPVLINRYTQFLCLSLFVSLFHSLSVSLSFCFILSVSVSLSVCVSVSLCLCLSLSSESPSALFDFLQPPFPPAASTATAAQSPPAPSPARWIRTCWPPPLPTLSSSPMCLPTHGCK